MFPTHEIAVQQPVEDMDDEEGENPVVEHGMPLPIVEGFGLVPIVEGFGLGVGTTSNGLTPALPISTEPNGIPVRAAPPGEVGDVAADDEALLLELVPHVPEVAAPPGNVTVPTSPPPSCSSRTFSMMDSPWPSTSCRSLSSLLCQPAPD